MQNATYITIIIINMGSVFRQAYLTLSPQANKVLRDLGDDVAVVVAQGAAADFWVCGEDLLAELLQLGVVTVEEEVPLQLFGTLHRAETTVPPEAGSLPFAQKHST